MKAGTPGAPPRRWRPRQELRLRSRAGTSRAAGVWRTQGRRHAHGLDGRVLVEEVNSSMMGIPSNGHA